MKKIKQPVVAGAFYPNNKEELLSQVKTFLRNAKQEHEMSSRAIIVPHAGYFYSGQIAAMGFQYLNKSAKNVFVFAPSHQVAFEGVALSSFDKWATPLGEVEVNQEINSKIKEKFGHDFFDEAFDQEHSLEVQIPFVQTLLPDAKIIPILTGNVLYSEIAKIISHFWDDEDNVFVISSDLSHFNDYDKAKKIDELTAEMIESNAVENFNYQQACGAIGVCGLVNFAKGKNFSLIQIEMKNSGDVSGDKLRVVGYGSWFLYEGEKENFIKKNFSELILNICKESILSGLNTGKPLRINLESYPPVLRKDGASFVTLEINDNLRGCIGSIIAHRPLIEDIAENAFNSAFSDPRFQPLSREESAKITIAVSILTAPVEMNFSSEEDLLNKLTPFVDGLIIKDGYQQAVYLPSVWEQLPEKQMFLDSLRRKAGMNSKHFSKTFKAYTFRTAYI